MTASSLEARFERRVSAALFLSLFAAQLGQIGLSPVLVQVAGELGVSTAAAGQLRTVAGLAAGFTALALPVATRRLGLRRLLVGGAGILAVASLASAAAPSFPLLLLAQTLVGVAVACLVAAATAAAAEWVPPAARARVLSWTLIGNPAAWIVGMPVIGLLGEVSWRYGLLALPLTAALVAAVAAARSPGPAETTAGSAGLRVALADPVLRRWLLGELAANSAWIGVLVYAGALFTESYGTSSAVTGAVLSLTAGAFVLGNLVFRRAAETDPRRPLIPLALAMAVLVALLGLARPTLVVSAVVLVSTAFLGGGRSLLGNAYGFQAEPERRLAAMAARAAANQFGYFVGAATAGVALAAWGYAGLGVVLGLLFVVAAAVVAEPRAAGAAAADESPVAIGHVAAGSPARLRPRRCRRATLPALLRRAAAPARAR